MKDPIPMEDRSSARSGTGGICNQGRAVDRHQGVEEMEADPWIVEDNLNQDLAGDKETDCDREVGHDRQKCVAGRIPNHLPRGQALGDRDQDEVFVHGRHHVVAHRQDESGHRGQDHGQCRQDRVAENAGDVGQVRPRGDRVDVVPEQAWEPLEQRAGLTEDQHEHQGEKEIGNRLKESGAGQDPVDP